MSTLSNLYYYKPNQQLSDPPRRIDADLCIYGGTPAGVAAAVQATRMGLKAVIAEFGQHIGGMTSSGLGRTDVGDMTAIGGISSELYEALGRHYGSDEPDGRTWALEPGVAERILTEWLEQAKVEVRFEQHLDSVELKSGRIQQITMEDGTIYSAPMFIDASYEGDLLARAGVSYHVGRESNTVYKETLNGIHFGHPKHNFMAWVDPYVVEGKIDSGLLPGITQAAPGVQGQGDDSVQAYNFRICLSSNPENQLPFPEPPSYNRDEFALLARYIHSGVWDALKLNKVMPNHKSDLNNWGGVSTDYIGRNYAWPEASYRVREKLFQEHVHYNMGMLYFLANDDSVPSSIRAEVRTWGLPADEFQATGGWPHQLYIREARRMISDVVMTEHHCRHYSTVEDSIGLAAYTMDSHNCRRLVLEGRCINEGNVEISPKGPYPISYRAIIPKGEECTNLVVPVCLSSSHIAYGSIRMEPVFMILGQSAATAAALALEHQCALQELDYGLLRSQLLADRQILQAEM
ncbi:FAD-dependent oxidoreductase [Paenibacillus sp. RC67]|uniref:FAD-dependent oxidoreductase n=1 Tax=Paenibacillus sp. RC67 TaxID=3039392 RepID=UPI0024AC9ACC|nr:FAD-dependent oxidoreductase [Paenibacillus sp. RC67]